MNLNQLVKEIKAKKIIGKLDVEVLDIQWKSNLVTKGDLFVCLKGKDSDGHDYIKQAENYGAVAVMTECECESALPQIIVEDTRKALSVISSEFYNNPSKKLKIIGVVGTNGKTTTSHLIYQIFKNNGVKVGVIGTLGAYYADKFIEPTLTTPDPMSLHKLFSDMLSCGIEVVVMEVSAHAIYWDKVYGINFEVGVFTNLSRDHLDFFNSMEEYKNTKLRFFKENSCKYIVVNSDDETGREISKNDSGVITYGVDNPADVFAIEIKENSATTQMILNLFDCIFEVEFNLVGGYNVLNALGAVTACSLAGLKPNKVSRGLKSVNGVTGRLECVYREDFKVYVDYAHTPDGLKKAIEALRPVCENRLITVFGCGGNRDHGKRAEMGEIAERYSDFVVVTSDNPRFEEPMEIIYEIEKGVLKSGKNYVLIEERAAGIEYAVEHAKKGDLILVAGKGGENYQDILGIKRPYNDKDTIIDCISRRES